MCLDVAMCSIQSLKVANVIFMMCISRVGLHNCGKIIVKSVYTDYNKELEKGER